MFTRLRALPSKIERHGYSAKRLLLSAILLAIAGVLIVAVIPRPDEHASAAVFFGIVLGAFVLGFLVAREPARPEPRGKEDPAQRRYLEERALILASLISRGVSELAALQEGLPEQQQLLTRQQQNNLLRDRGLWDKLDPEEQFLATSAQGSWSEDDSALTYVWCEQLRLLRWVLRMDDEVAPLEDLPGPAWKAVYATLETAFDPPLLKPMLASWDVRVERDRAAQYTARTLAEFAHRGQYQTGSADTSSLLRWRNFVSGTGRDLRLGRGGISELDDHTLHLIASVASTRWQYAAYLVDFLAGSGTPSLLEWEASNTDNGVPVSEGIHWA